MMSKSGLIAQFFDDVKSELSAYLTIDQRPILNYASFDNPRPD